MKNTYKKSGVNYEYLDEVKRFAQNAGVSTKKNLPKAYQEKVQSRGESAYIIEAQDCYFANVVEGLGTKNLIADQFRQVTGKTYYDAMAHDTVAAIINDLITVGATPLSVCAYWATGNSVWWKDKQRSLDLITGWKKACDLARCTWGGGETPALSGVIDSKTIDLAGSAFGVITPKERLVVGDRVQSGDVIVFVESNGIHANGLSLIRKLAKAMPGGYKTKLHNGTHLGEELLKPTHIYNSLVQDALDAGVDIHYMVNITGHGFRKLMRMKKPFTYVVDILPKKSPLFSFIQHAGKLSNKEMFSTFNMGAGFAFFINKKYIVKLFTIAKKNSLHAWVGGYIKNGERQVQITPLGITYGHKDLNIR